MKKKQVEQIKNPDAANTTINQHKNWQNHWR